VVLSFGTYLCEITKQNSINPLTDDGITSTLFVKSERQEIKATVNTENCNCLVFEDYSPRR
jgi:hypothetical protein